MGCTGTHSGAVAGELLDFSYLSYLAKRAIGCGRTQRKTKPNGAHRFVNAAAARTGYPCYRYANLRARARQCACRHGAYHRLADRTMLDN